jgi:hypothetical protein
MKSPRFLLPCLLILAAAHTVNGITFETRGSDALAAPPGPLDIVEALDDSSLTVAAGTSANSALARDRATLTVGGGQIATAMAFDQSTFNIEDGSLGSLRAMDTSRVNIRGGTVLGDVALGGQSSLWLFGGAIEGSIVVQGLADVYIVADAFFPPFQTGAVLGASDLLPNPQGQDAFDGIAVGAAFPDGGNPLLSIRTAPRDAAPWEGSVHLLSSASQSGTVIPEPTYYAVAGLVLLTSLTLWRRFNRAAASQRA